jgi:CheY-like chemotaxis protein
LPVLDQLHSQGPEEKPGYPNLKGKRVLIVEDDPVLAVDYHFQLKDVGARAEGFKATNQEALSYLASHEVDAAIVDFLLCDGTGESIIDGLKSRGIPFIVVSACTFRMHGEVSASQVLSKPVAPGDICRALSEVVH